MFKPPLNTWPYIFYRPLWWTVLLLLLLPALSLLLDYINNNLGINGLETLERATGRWSVILLILTLAVTPGRRILVRLCRWTGRHWGRRLPDWNFLMHMRRMLGLTCYFYVCAHVLLYFEFDIGWDWIAFYQELIEKRYILAGAVNLVLLTVLAITSSDTMIRLLKRNWRRIHRLVYIIALLAIAHWWWLSKAGDLRSLPYVILLLSLLAYRVLVWMGWFPLPDDDGMPAATRNVPRPPPP